MADTTPILDAPKTETPIVDRKTAIADAIKTQEAPPVVEDKKEEEKKEEEKPAVNTELTDEDKVLQQQGLDLIKALKDPQQAPIIARFLAEQTGVLKQDTTTTKTETKEAADAVLEALKESLGPEFQYLAEKIAPGMKKAFSQIVEQNNADIREEFHRQEEEKLALQSKTALDSLTEDFFGKGEDLPKNVEQEMSKLMDKYQPSPDSTVKEYVNDIFKLAVSNLNLSKSDKAREAKTNKNRNDAASRLASERAPAESNIQQNTSKMDRRTAIRLAVEAAEKG